MGQEGIFSETTYAYALTNLLTKFKVSSIILTRFRQGKYPPPQNEPLKSPPRLE